MSGDRGLISYFDKKQILINLQFKELKLLENIEKLEFNNSLLSDNLDLDFVETLIRERNINEKKNDKIYIINNDEN